MRVRPCRTALRARESVSLSAAPSGTYSLPLELGPIPIRFRRELFHLPLSYWTYPIATYRKGVRRVSPRHTPHLEEASRGVVGSESGGRTQGI